MAASASPTTPPRRVVIVGASLAGASAAHTLRQDGFVGEIILVGAESELPYERPPLSKGLLLGTQPEQKIFLHDADYYHLQRIGLRLDTRATALDVDESAVTLTTGERLTFDRLLIATGGAARRLSVPGADLAGVYYLRSLTDARALERVLRPGLRVAIVGAGFIGVEVAAVCRQRGMEVTVVEPLVAPLQRALGEQVGGYFAALHRAQGITLRLGEGVTALEGSSHVEAVATTSGARLVCDLVVVGVGMRPADDWLRASGLALGDGVLVDAYCETSAPGVFAAGDIARWPYQPVGDTAPRHIRLEHWDNALRQGETAARNMLGLRVAYAPIPYFWSEQFSWLAQYVGYAGSWDHVALRGDPEAGSFVAFYLAGRRLRAALAVNRVRDLAPLRKLIARGAALDPARLADETLDLRPLVAQATDA